MQNVKNLADIPHYTLVHSFGKPKHPGDGIWYAADQVRPWCIYYAYSGHYFTHLLDALQYAVERKFIPAYMIGGIEQNLQDRGFT